MSHHGISLERFHWCVYSCVHVFMHFLVFGFQTAVVTIAVDNQPSPSPTPPNDTEITPPENKKPRMESPLLPHCYSLPRSETSSPQLNQVNCVTMYVSIVVSSVWER